MAYKEESIDVDVPLRTAYNQWTQFEEFPQFMDHVEEVRQLDDKRLHWKAKIAGKAIEWDAEITDQTPDTRVAWRSVTGPRNGGAVLFTAVDADTTRVTVRMDVYPEGIAENLASAFGILAGQIKGDLKRFKEFTESLGVETGAWRGEIHGHTVKR
jgi:uncharacterized membrane protein